MSQYQKHLDSDTQEIKKALEPLSRPPSSMAELASKLKVGEAHLNDAANDLGGLKAPKEIEKDNNTLASGLSKFADELDSFREAAEKNDPQLLRKTFADLQNSHALVEVRNATTDMKKKGYKLSGLGS
jgi:hypothetical protein